MSQPSNVISLKEYQESTQQELVDDISARAFIFLRDQADSNEIPIKTIFTEHLIGLAAIVKAVEGESEVKRLFDEVMDNVLV